MVLDHGWGHQVVQEHARGRLNMLVEVAKTACTTKTTSLPTFKSKLPSVIKKQKTSLEVVTWMRIQGFKKQILMIITKYHFVLFFKYQVTRK